MKYDLFKHRWSLTLSGHWAWLNGWWPGWSDLGHRYTVALETGITTVDAGRDYNIVLAAKFLPLQLSNSIVYETQQWHTLDPHAKHYSKVIKGSK